MQIHMNLRDARRTSIAGAKAVGTEMQFDPTKAQGREATPDEIRNIKDIFKKFDLNGDGTISLDEMTAIMQKLCPEMSTLNIEVLFNTIDANHNGSIDCDEFLEWLLNP